MIVRKSLLSVGLLILFCIAGCETVTSQDDAANTDKENATPEEVTGKVVRATPCRTLVEIDVKKASEGGETTRMQFFCFDAEARQSAQGVEKGDTVNIQYVFSPETQRNRVSKITRVTK